MRNKEIWKDIPGFEGHYQASSLGRIRSVDRKIRRGTTDDKEWRLKGKILYMDNRKDGYAQVKLCRTSGMKNYLAHRLVALAFIGPCPENKEVNHKDFNRKNNTIKNLEYVTRSENLIHNVLNNRNSYQKLTVDQVLSIRNMIDHKTPKKIIANLLGVSAQTINDIIKYRSWRHT